MIQLKSLLCLIAISLPLYAQSVDEAIDINASGVMAMRLRMALVAENIANLNTLKDNETGLPWQKRFLKVAPARKGVKVVGIGRSDEPFGRYFDPAVPQSDELGFTYHPNVNLPNEMVNLKYFKSMFEANVNAFKVTKAMYQTSIDLLK